MANQEKKDASATQKHVTVPRLLQLKSEGQKIAMVTAYDYPSACLADTAGVDMLLVGDSLGMVVLGYESTLPVTMEDMLHHTRAVARGTKRAMVVADMPFLSYQGNADEAVINAGRLLKEGGAHAVKLEGGAHLAPLVSRLVDSGIPVVGHLGLLPQSLRQLGGYRAQGKTSEGARRLLQDAKALEEAGACSIVLEVVPAPLATAISERLSIPTIGIGAGAGCDGQVQVMHDLLGITERTPRHARRFAELGAAIRTAFESYAQAVREGSFPGPENSLEMDPEELRKALEDDTRADDC